MFVVLGHKHTTYNVGFVNAFFDSIPGKILTFSSMPAFFMISGITYRETTIKKFLVKTFHELVKPYLYVMLAFAVCFPVIHYLSFKWWPGAFSESTRYFLAFLFGIPKAGKILFGISSYTNTPVWFFLGLFVSLNLMNLIMKVKVEKLRPVLVVISTVCGYVLSVLDIDYFCISQGMVAVGYCYLGYLIKKHKIYANKYSLWACLVLLIPTICQAKIGQMDMAESIYKLGYIECILAACASMMLVFLGLACGRKEWKILDPIKSVGVYSYWILCIHAVESWCIPWYRWSEIMGENCGLAFLGDLIVTLVLMVGGCILLKLISRLRYKIRNLEKKLGLVNVDRNTIVGGLKKMVALFNALLDHLKLDEKKYKIRLDMFNLLKGVLIILVVLGHKFDFYSDPTLNAIFESNVMKVLRNSAMPAFFMVAGMSFRGSTAKKSLNKTFHDLIIPYLYVMVAFAVCFPLIHYLTFDYWEGALRESTRYFLAFLLGLPESGKMFLGYELYNCSAAWFMVSMFLVFNILNLVLKIKNEMLRHVVILVLYICGFMLEENGINYYCISRALRDTGYCYIGWLMKNHKLYANRYMPIFLVILAAITVYSANPGEDTSDLVISILSGCSGLLLVILGIICGRIEWKILDPIKSVGVYSYWILCIHSVELRCMPWYKWSEYMANNQLLAYFADLAFAGVVIAIFCFAFKKISRWNYKRKMKARSKVC